MTPFAAKIVGNEEGTDAPANAVFPYWSFTKTLLAAAIFALADAGEVALDKPWHGQPFTLRQIISHRAGISNYGALAEYHDAVRRGDPAWALAEMLERVDANRLLFEPGSACSYSNIGYTYLRTEIEERTGADLDAAMRGLLFSPLGVNDVRIALSKEDMRTMYWTALHRYDPGWVYHGLAIGTPMAAAQLLHRLMTTDFLGDESKAQMFRATAARERDGGPFHRRFLGSGIMIGAAPSLGLCAGHSGEGPGSVCAVYHCRDLSPGRTVSVFAGGSDATLQNIEIAAIKLAGSAGMPA